MITEDDLAAARVAWGEGLVSISKAYETDGIQQARDLAGRILDAAYGYDMGPVLFKPTLSGGRTTFRTSRKGALSYFVGHDPDYPKDAGFAIRGWRKTESETAASFIEGDVAMWMGWMRFTDKDGQTIQTDKTFGYKKDAQGVLRIVLHHSSLPYEPC
ncbi:phosphoribosyl-AMP cyclohydrolase [Pseudooceanicola lipolyticus]|uniref:Phosphoribosyl-AMP cyclohydrolase n=1 Tax=Pseudooceanicola lipolyticus TaxID=2029104 RepID=A0A2M8IY75_9RHOB|nr:phosphoribosyl-AMP cyclohydrolase [Pseudooceanicola lipolyticus]PJE35462.1 phosphoribosyl-AMP cyclohydrolase [Pseudooceanicola lipolyticus]